MKMLNKAARNYALTLLNKATMGHWLSLSAKHDEDKHMFRQACLGIITDKEYSAYLGYTAVVSNYIGNHSKHMRGTPQPQQTKGKYKTARERNRY